MELELRTKIARAIHESAPERKSDVIHLGETDLVAYLSVSGLFDAADAILKIPEVDAALKAHEMIKSGAKIGGSP